ncbi:AzlC family ABC transporter permease [Methanosphaera sp.]
MKHEIIKKDNKQLTALKCAFPQTIPILTGFLFLGLTYGLYSNTQGFIFIYPLILSLLVFAGSAEFMVITFLTGVFNPILTFIVTFIINARHIFYSITMLDKYRGLGWKSIYLIYGLCDETFAINYTTQVPKNVDKGWFYFWITLLNQIYWVSGATLGGLIGPYITFNLKGVDFVLTALFVVIFMNQFLKEDNHTGSYIGILFPIISIIIFGRENFIIPAMISFIIFFTIFRKKYDSEYRS